MTVAITTHRIVLSNGYAKIIRGLAQSRAGFARRTARPGEPHAKARARIVALEDAVASRMEREMMFGGGYVAG